MELTDKNFKVEVLGSDIPVLVDFWASWCPPCKMIEPVIEKLEKEYSGRVKVGKLNVDRNPLVAGNYKIQGVPTFITFKDGKIVDKVVAAVPEKTLRDMMEGLLG